MKPKLRILTLFLLMLVLAYLYFPPSANTPAVLDHARLEETSPDESKSATRSDSLETVLQDVIGQSLRLASEAPREAEYVDELMVGSFDRILSLTPAERAGLRKKMQSLNDLERKPGLGGEPRIEDVLGRERYQQYLKFLPEELRVSKLVRELNLSPGEAEDLRIAYWETKNDSTFYMQDYEGNLQQEMDRRFIDLLDKRLEGSISAEDKKTILMLESQRIAEDVMLDPMHYGLWDKDLISDNQDQRRPESDLTRRIRDLDPAQYLSALEKAKALRPELPKNGEIDKVWLEGFIDALREEAKTDEMMQLLVEEYEESLEYSKKLRQRYENRKLEKRNLEKSRDEIRERRRKEKKEESIRVWADRLSLSQEQEKAFQRIQTANDTRVTEFWNGPIPRLKDKALRKKRIDEDRKLRREETIRELSKILDERQLSVYIKQGMQYY